MSLVEALISSFARVTVDDLVTSVATRIGDVIVARMRDGDGRRVSQDKSPLGPRGHIGAVKRRVREEMEAGELPGARGAWISGRLHLLSQDALDEELGRRTASSARLAKVPRKPAPANDDADESVLHERLLAQMRGAR